DLRRSLLLRSLAVLRCGDGALPRAVARRRSARLERIDALLLGFVTGQGNCPLVLGLQQIALDLLLDEMRKLAIAEVREQHPVGLAQQSLLAGDVGPIGRVVTAVI